MASSRGSDTEAAALFKNVLLGRCFLVINIILLLYIPASLLIVESG
jgi:hypothetical protein